MENAHKCPADLLVQPIPYHSLPRETQFSLEPRPSEGVEVSGLPITLSSFEHTKVLSMRQHLCARNQGPQWGQLHPHRYLPGCAERAVVLRSGRYGLDKW
jgi:hypothetical protein